MVVVIVFEDDDEDVDDDGEDPFPNAFVLALFPPFAFPFRPDEDLLRVRRKENAGEEVTESKARIFMSSSGRSKVQTVFFFRARANGLTTRLRPPEGKTFSARQTHRTNRRRV